MSNKDETTLAASWESFREGAMCSQSPPDQVREMRRAFYAGAWGQYNLIMLAMHRSAGFELLEAKAQRYEAEGMDFLDKVNKGEA